MVAVGGGREAPRPPPTCVWRPPAQPCPGEISELMDWSNKELVMKRLTTAAHSWDVPPILQQASAELRADREVVLTAVGLSGDSLRHAPAEMRTDREMVLAAVAQHGYALAYASVELRADRDFVLAAVAVDGLALKHAVPRLRADRGVVVAALAQWGFALGHAAPELRADREVAMAAVASSGLALQHASMELRADREFMMAAVARDGSALEYAPTEMQADREMVMAAVSQNGCALCCASAELRTDREVVLAAVAQNGCALEYVSKELRADREVALTAVARCGGPLKGSGGLMYASAELQVDPVLQLLSGMDLTLAAAERRLSLALVLLPHSTGAMAKSPEDIVECVGACLTAKIVVRSITIRHGYWLAGAPPGDSEPDGIADAVAAAARNDDFQSRSSAAIAVDATSTVAGTAGAGQKRVSLRRRACLSPASGSCPDPHTINTRF
jgi:hypothetical protein